MSHILKIEINCIIIQKQYYKQIILDIRQEMAELLPSYVVV